MAGITNTGAPPSAPAPGPGGKPEPKRMSDNVRVAIIAAVATIVAASIGAWAVVASGAVEVNVSGSDDDNDELALTATSLRERVDELESQNETLTSERDAAAAEADTASSDDADETGDDPTSGTSDDAAALYSDEQLSVVMTSGCTRTIDLAEPRVLTDYSSVDVTIEYADCNNPNEIVLNAYGAPAVSPASQGVDGAGCADAVRTAGADSVGITAGNSYCVDLGTSPVTDTLRRVVRLDVSTIDSTTVSILATAWDV